MEISLPVTLAVLGAALATKYSALSLFLAVTVLFVWHRHRPWWSSMLIGLGVFTPFVGWLLWGLLTGLWFNRHPQLADPEMRLDGRRRLLVLVALAVFVLSFVPAPLMPIAAS